MLELDTIQLAYPGFTLRANFSVPTNARVALLGPSGAGKSTLLSAIAGFVAPAAGRIRLDGTDITMMAPGTRGLAMVFQDQNLFPHMTAFENVGLALSPSLRLSPRQAESIDAALAQVGLQGMGTRKPGELSGGQQARVTLARALLQKARILLLDEPFSALGPGLRHEMLGLVRELCAASGMGLLMVSHDPEDARFLCDQTIVVANGTAMAPQPTTEILENPPEGLADYLGRTR